LAAALDIDDGQSSVAEIDRRIDPEIFTVRSTVR
jgi:hypothetical protein